MKDYMKWIVIMVVAAFTGALLTGAAFVTRTGFSGASPIMETNPPISVQTSDRRLPEYGGDPYNMRTEDGCSDTMPGQGSIDNQTGAVALTLDEVEQATEAYIAGDRNLEITELMAFSDNFYAQVREKDSGRYALELLIDPYSGEVFPEMGPNMMWNTRYGTMGGVREMGSMMGRGYDVSGSPASEMGLTAGQALSTAQEYLDQVMPGSEAADPVAFYGYYTLHVIQEGEFVGMLSVHGTTGQVWYHTWHGAYLGAAGNHE
jgi:hypothetical protein